MLNQLAQQPKKTLFIGIDPDVTKSGVAIWDSANKRFLSIETLLFAETIERIREYKDVIKCVHVEASWLNKSNWHLTYKDAKTGTLKTSSAQRAAEIGLDLGRNQQRGIDLIELIEYFDIPVRPIKPIVGNWWKEDGKRFKTITKWEKRTNPEQRDAAMLVYQM